MRTLIFWRLTSLLLVVSGPLVAPELNERAFSVVAQEDDADDDGDDNRGHGNDSDGNDEDNPSRGRGNNDDNPGRGNDDDKDDDDDDRDDSAAVDDVVQMEGYAVEVICEFDSDSNSTECVFTGIAPSGTNGVSHIDLPQDEVCAEVTGGTFAYVDPDPDTHVIGYQSAGGDASLTLILEGDVTTTGAATYWFKTADGVFPSTGPGLGCREAMAGAATEETAGTPADVTDSTGALLVNTYLCTDVPEQTAEFDWFGACDPVGGMHEFTLAGVDAGTGDQLSEESSTEGSAAFESLAPGAYLLEIVDTQWCHAESDNVTSEGTVIIEAGQRTTVWAFVCDDGTVK